MEIKDVIHGSIAIDDRELPVLDSPYFQRLRFIKQLGFSEYSYPSASHSRYIHSLGAMQTATHAFHAIFGGPEKKEFQRFLPLLRFAALLHDVGHGPLSHTTEFAMPPVRTLEIPGRTPTDRKATHEDYTLKIILDSEIAEFLDQAGKGQGFGREHVAALIDEGNPNPNIENFFHEKINGEVIDFFPVLRHLISSEIDADRMDYLRRDSYYAGVSYGTFDAQWLLSNLTYYVTQQKAYLCLRNRALYTFEDFLISRYHMFLMVYFHYKGVIYEEMLSEYFNSPDCDYRLPSNLKDYLQCHDAHLYAHLAQSSNPWAKRIIERKPYRLLYEQHSNKDQKDSLFYELTEKLRKQKIHFIVSNTVGQLSKYFKNRRSPIWVRYENYYSEPKYLLLDECTELFQRYPEERWIQRIYVSPEDYPLLKKN